MIADLHNLDTSAIDFEVTQRGTIWTFVLKTDEARDWVATNVNIPDYMETPTGFHADWRPAREIAMAMHAEGLAIQINR